MNRRVAVALDALQNGLQAVCHFLHAFGIARDQFAAADRFEPLARFLHVAQRAP